MFKKILAKLPTKDSLNQYKSLRIFNQYLCNEELWHPHIHSLAKATAIGIFCMLLPIPFQMLLATIFAIILRAYMPLSIALVWVSNPLTMGPLLYLCYKVGSKILYNTPQQFNVNLHNIDSVLHNLHLIWKPLIIGSIVAGLIGAVIAYFLFLIIAYMFFYKKLKRK